MKIPKYEIKPGGLRDVIVAGVVSVAIIAFVIEKHRMERECTSCQQKQSQRTQGDALQDLANLLTTTGVQGYVPQGPLTVDQIRSGMI